MKNAIPYRGLHIQLGQPRSHTWSATIYHGTRRLYTTAEVSSQDDCRNMAKGMVDWYFHDLVNDPDKLMASVYERHNKETK